MPARQVAQGRARRRQACVAAVARAAPEALRTVISVAFAGTTGTLCAVALKKFMGTKRRRALAGCYQG